MPTQPSSLGLQLTCDPEDDGERVEDGLDIVPGQPGQVPVVDTVTGDCDVSSLLAGLTYWCQGKMTGCSLEADSVSSLTSCPNLGGVRVHWHSESDYSSTEIPCPAYNNEHLSKKFSKYPKIPE